MNVGSAPERSISKNGARRLPRCKPRQREIALQPRIKGPLPVLDSGMSSFKRGRLICNHQQTQSQGAKQRPSGSPYSSSQTHCGKYVIIIISRSFMSLSAQYVSLYSNLGLSPSAEGPL